MSVILQQQWLSLDDLKASCLESDKRLLDNLHSLLTVDSLTQGLEALDPQFNVELISLSETDQYYSDSQVKPIQLCRKVQLLLSSQPVIYAESHCSVDATEWIEYLHCGTSSLGRRLFAPEAELERSSFSYALFSLKDIPFSLLADIYDENSKICARRSFFKNKGQILFITEWYLPLLIEKSIRY